MFLPFKLIYQKWWWWRQKWREISSSSPDKFGNFFRGEFVEKAGILQRKPTETCLIQYLYNLLDLINAKPAIRRTVITINDIIPGYYEYSAAQE